MMKIGAASRCFELTAWAILSEEATMASNGKRIADALGV
jgi:hypothetical protein